MNKSQNIFASANKKSTVRILKKIQAAISAQELSVLIGAYYNIESPAEEET